MHPITKMLAEVDEALHELDRGRHEQLGYDVQLAIDVMLRDLGFTEFEWPSQHGVDRSDILAEKWERDNVDHEYISPAYKFSHRSFVLEEYRPSTKEWSPIYVESLTFLRGYLAAVKDQLAVHPGYRIVEEDTVVAELSEKTITQACEERPQRQKTKEMTTVVGPDGMPVAVPVWIEVALKRLQSFEEQQLEGWIR